MPSSHHGTLTVYIEGDGHAWIDSRTVSPDPTPHQPVVLRLALQDPAAAVAYLARPCQYIKGPRCHYRYWTYARFSPEITQALNEGIDQLKQMTQTRSVILVGFSGGGGLALLLAASRNDVKQVIAVAGNLDTAAWAAFHKLTPLSGSINPITALNYIPANTKLCFLYGDEDKAFPPALVNRFRTAVRQARPDARFIIKHGIGHAWPPMNIKSFCEDDTPPAHTH